MAVPLRGSSTLRVCYAEDTIDISFPFAPHLLDFSLQSYSYNSNLILRSIYYDIMVEILKRPASTFGLIEIPSHAPVVDLSFVIFNIVILSPFCHLFLARFWLLKRELYRAVSSVGLRRD